MFRLFEVSEHRKGNMKKRRTKKAKQNKQADEVKQTKQAKQAKAVYVDSAKKAYDDCRANNGSVKDCMKKLREATKKKITQNDIPDVWHCKNKCYLSQGKNEILVVISQPDGEGTFTWLRIYNGEYDNKNESLYWARYENDEYVLMDEYIEDLNVSHSDEYDSGHSFTFQKKVGTTDTINSNIQKMRDILKSIS